MRFIYPILLAVMLLQADNINAQLPDNQIKEYLNTQKFAIDTNANAIVLYERTNVEVVLEDREFKETKQFIKTIKILKSEGLAAAKVTLRIPRESIVDYVNKIHGKTININGDDIEETNLKSSAVSQTKNGDVYEVLFTLPDVKIGSIIQFSYNVSSPFYYKFPDWEIEGTYPKLATEYYFSYPAIVTCAWQMHMDYELVKYANKKKALAANDPFSEFSKTSAASTDYNYYLWIRRNVPTLVHQMELNKKPPEHMEISVQRVNSEDVGK